MTRFVQFVMAGLLCCVMAFSASAQDKGKQGKPEGGKEPRGIERTPKGGDRGGNQGGNQGGGNQGGNRGNDNRGNDGGGKPGKHGNKPNF